MIKLTLNNTEFTINGFGRYTNIDSNGVHTYANVMFSTNEQYEALAQIGVITNLSITIDNVSVYSLSNISAKITNISEILEDQGMLMSAQISFNPDNSEVEQ